MMDKVGKILAPAEETPKKKRHRHKMEISEEMQALLTEKKMKMDMGMPTGDLDVQMEELSKERKAIDDEREKEEARANLARDLEAASKSNQGRQGESAQQQGNSA